MVVIRDSERDRVPFDMGDFATGKLFNTLVYCCILWITLSEGADDNFVARAYMVKQCTVVATRIAAIDVLLSVGIQVCSFPDWALSRSVSAILVSHFHWCPSEFRLCAINRKEEHAFHQTKDAHQLHQASCRSNDEPSNHPFGVCESSSGYHCIQNIVSLGVVRKVCQC